MKFNNIFILLSCIALTNAKLVMLIRHGEKISDEYTDLSPQGKARASCLINAFGENGIYASPQKIFAQSPSEKKQSTRPRDTVVPLGNALGITVDLSYTSGKIRKLTDDILASSDEVTLVSWSNKKIPEIAEAFGIVNVPEWPKGTFDDIWMIYDSATPSYLKNSNNKREVFSGSDGFKMEIVKQNIEDCINGILKQSNINNNDNNNVNNKKTDYYNNDDYYYSKKDKYYDDDDIDDNETSDSIKLTSSLFMIVFSLISYIFINFY